MSNAVPCCDGRCDCHVTGSGAPCLSCAHRLKRRIRDSLTAAIVDAVSADIGEIFTGATGKVITDSMRETVATEQAAQDFEDVVDEIRAQNSD